MTDAQIIDWLERQSTLHRQVDILYVVDGYQVTLMYDGEPVSGKQWHGASLREAITKAAKCQNPD